MSQTSSVPENFAFRLAERRVTDFSDRAVEAPPSETTGWPSCEAFLQQGIDAYRWLRKAEDLMREADAAGVFQFTGEIRQACDLLYVAWLAAKDVAENRVQEQLQRGVRPASLDEFRRTCAEVEELVEQRRWMNLGREARVRLLAEEPW